MVLFKILLLSQLLVMLLKKMQLILQCYEYILHDNQLYINAQTSLEL